MNYPGIEEDTFEDEDSMPDEREVARTPAKTAAAEPAPASIEPLEELANSPGVDDSMPDERDAAEVMATQPIHGAPVQTLVNQDSDALRKGAA